MKKFISRILVIAMVMGLIGAVPVQAASISGGIVYFDHRQNDKYTKADVTGDGKADTIVTKVTSTKTALYVNGTAVKAWKTSDTLPTIKILRYSDGKAYLEITTENYAKGLTSGGIFKVTDGALKCVFNYNSQVKTTLLEGDGFITNGDAFDMLTATKLKNDVLYLRAYLGTKSLGEIKVDNLRVTYANGKFTLAKNPGTLKFTIVNTSTGELKTYMRARKELTVYKKAASSVAAAFTIAKGAKFTPLKASIIDRYIYVYIKDANGNYGWIKPGASLYVKEKGRMIWG